MNRKEVIEYFKTISEDHSKAFYEAIQYCNIGKDAIHNFEQESTAYDMVIKSLEAWDEVLAFINKQLINRPFRNYESTLESRAYEHVKAFIEQKLSEVNAMTCEEAIKEIEWVKEKGFVADKNIIGTDRIIMACDMAIKSLKEDDTMEIYESKVIANIVEKMNETKDIHELNKLYNEAEKELFLVYGTLFERLHKQEYV